MGFFDQQSLTKFGYLFKYESKYVRVTQLFTFFFKFIFSFIVIMFLFYAHFSCCHFYLNLYLFTFDKDKTHVVRVDEHIMMIQGIQG